MQKKVKVWIIENVHLLVALIASGLLFHTALTKDWSIVPFLLVAFSDTIVKKEFKYAMLILIIPIYLFSLAYISQNVMPISDWAPFL